MKKEISDNNGQAMIVLLFVTAIVVALVLQIASLSFSSVSLGNEYAEGLLLTSQAESRLEDALIKYLRNPDYAGGTTASDGITCTISLSVILGGNELTASCERNQRSRAVAVSAIYDNGSYLFSPIRER